jgi:hypothetical protein
MSVLYIFVPIDIFKIYQHPFICWLSYINMSNTLCNRHYILQTNLIDPPMMQPTLGPPWFFFLSFRLYSNNAKSEVWTLIMLRQPSCVLLIPVSRLIPHLPVHNHFHRCHDQSTNTQSPEHSSNRSRAPCASAHSPVCIPKKLSAEKRGVCKHLGSYIRLEKIYS